MGYLVERDVWGKQFPFPMATFDRVNGDSTVFERYLLEVKEIVIRVHMLRSEFAKPTRTCWIESFCGYGRTSLIQIEATREK